MATAESVEGATESAGAPDAVVLETQLTPPRVRAEHVSRRELLTALLEGHPEGGTRS